MRLERDILTRMGRIIEARELSFMIDRALDAYQALSSPPPLQFRIAPVACAASCCEENNRQGFCTRVRAGTLNKQGQCPFFVDKNRKEIEKQVVTRRGKREL